MKKSRRIISCITAVSMAAAFMPMLISAEGTVTISTASEFKSFTESCVYDGYSKDKKFVLQNDIDLSGVEIKPAEVFCGTFEGGGHSVKNVLINAEGSDKGLFCRTSDEAQIRDLNVTGEIRVIGSDSGSFMRKRAMAILEKNNVNVDDEKSSAVGGIVGHNDGKIINCTYSGSVKGTSQTGGIAGFNGMRAVIDTCLSSAKITGDSSVGGVAGYNEGRIKLSKNSGTICPEATEDTVNIGGICGENKGAVVICTNSGAVGSEGFGDNAGGICGVQSGEIRECINNADIQGRRSVGGICGRFEPYTDIDLSYESAKEAVRKQADTLKDDIESARGKVLDYVADLLGGSGDFSSLLSALGLSDTAEHHRSNLDSLTDSASRMMNSIGDAAASSDLGGISQSLTDMLDEAKDALGSGSDSLSEVSEDLRDLGSSLDTTLGSVDDFLNEFSGKGDEISTLIDNLNSALDKGEEDMDDIKNNLTRNLNSISRSIAIVSGNLDDMHDDIQSILKKLKNMNSTAAPKLKEMLEKLDASVTALEGTLTNLKASADKLKSLIDSITGGGLPARTSAPSERGYSAVPEADTESGYDVEAVVGAVKGLLCTPVYAAEEERTAIINLVSTDISIPRLIGGENADTALVRYCINNGAVNASENAGGIAGSTGFESTLRSGENITLPDGTKVDSNSVLKAVIDACISTGEITSKGKYSGGVCGRGDMGHIRNSLTTGEVTSEEDGYAGGIAGTSNGEIEKCIAINDVYGKNNIGGIAGSARNIRSSYALPRLDGAVEKSGAIAGSASGEVKNCYFIDEGLSGINGASLSGKAEAAAPERMYSDNGTMPEGLPLLSEEDYYMSAADKYMPQLKALAQNNAENIGALLQSWSSELALFRFKVTFKDKDKELRVITKEYGEALSEAEVPELSADGENVPMWDKDVKAPIIRRTVFNAVYSRATSTISTTEEPPLLLVEGVFDDGTSVSVSEEAAEREFDGYKTGRAYSFLLSRDAYGKIKVHIRNSKGAADAVALKENGQWHVEECETDGSYAVFEAAGPCGFILLHKRKTPIVPIAIIIAVLAGGAVYIWWRRRVAHGKKKENI